MRGIMSPNAGPTRQVKAPKDFPVLYRIQTQNLATVADHIHAVTFDGYRRSDAALRPIEINILFALGHDQLPEETACGFVETRQNTAITLLLRIARMPIIRANVNAATGD